MWFWVGPDEGGAALGDLAAADRRLSARPPTRFRASSTITEWPACWTLRRGGEAGEAGAHHDHVGGSLRPVRAEGRDPPRASRPARPRPGPDQAAAADRLVGHPFLLARSGGDEG